ncbi:hypothetical protein BDZ91DRAFT_793050 [Kalaharituber pfeilii]|nr:hypothetical protein BDZ91DRAFT_793050 [Kalaharituber pfeilii]
MAAMRQADLMMVAGTLQIRKTSDEIQIEQLDPLGSATLRKPAARPPPNSNVAVASPRTPSTPVVSTPLPSIPLLKVCKRHPSSREITPIKESESAGNTHRLSTCSTNHSSSSSSSEQFVVLKSDDTSSVSALDRCKGTRRPKFQSRGKVADGKSRFGNHRSTYEGEGFEHVQLAGESEPKPMKLLEGNSKSKKRRWYVLGFIKWGKEEEP